MTAAFRSCLPRFYSNTINEDLSENSVDGLSILSHKKRTDSSSSSEEQLSRLKSSKMTKNRGPRYTRRDGKSKPFLKRLVGTIFGDYGTVTKTKQRRSKKSLLPSNSKIEKQFEKNEQTLNSLVTLLTEIESTPNPQARNNNRIDDTSTTSFHARSKHSHHSRKMIDNQQQTQLHDPSWLDVIHDDQTTSNAWARIRRRLKPNEQKDILRALMIICANLFDVPLENKHL